MTSSVFALRGRITYADGSLAPGIHVAVVGSDPDRDDLIAIGDTRDDGTFRVSFTQRAFNQELADREPLPNLYLVLSVHREGELVPVAHHPVGTRPFREEEDLGAIPLPLNAGTSPPPCPDCVRRRARAAPSRASIRPAS